MSPKNSSADRARLISVGVLILCLASVAGHLAIRVAMVGTLSRKLGKATQTELAGLVQAKQDAEAKFQAALLDAEAAVREGRAEKVRAQEFQRRQAMEAGFAQSPGEKRLLEMAKVSQDPSLDPAGRLQKLAKLASPKSSGVRVSPVKKGYMVEVAVPLSSIQAETHGGRRDTNDVHREVRRVVAGIMRDLFGFGAAAGLQSVEVSCQQQVEVRGAGLGAEKRQEYRELYRAKLEPPSPANFNWLAMNRIEILPWAHVTNDEFTRMVSR